MHPFLWHRYKDTARRRCQGDVKEDEIAHEDRLHKAFQTATRPFSAGLRLDRMHGVHAAPILLSNLEANILSRELLFEAKHAFDVEAASRYARQLCL